MIDSAGALNVYFNPVPPATFDVAASFARGTLIAGNVLRHQNTLNATAPNRGLATGAGELTQVTAAPIPLGGQPVQLGRPGLLQRLASSGEGTRLEPVAPRAMLFFAGHTVVSGTLPSGQLPPPPPVLVPPPPPPSPLPPPVPGAVLQPDASIQGP